MIPEWVPNIIAKVPKTSIKIFLINFQYANPKPSFQKTTISMNTGNSKPKNEKNNAPTMVIIGEIWGTPIDITTEK